MSGRIFTNGEVVVLTDSIKTELLDKSFMFVDSDFRILALRACFEKHPDFVSVLRQQRFHQQF
jgi:hypothetical protein